MGESLPLQHLDGPAEAVTLLAASAPWRLLLHGAAGSGKSSLAAALAPALARSGALLCLGADPGRPAFGPPGALALARWEAGWRIIDREPLCTLDAGRFRLPLVMAVDRLLGRAPPARLLVDAPGVTRGVAGAELLPALAQAAAVDGVAVLAGGPEPALATELAVLGVPVWRITPHPDARRPPRRTRDQERTRAWDAYLGGAPRRELPLRQLKLLGTPPPTAAVEAWRGRQVALGSAERWYGMGEVEALEGGSLRVRTPVLEDGVDTLLVRDARRGADGSMGTAEARGGGAARNAPGDVAPVAGGGDGGPPLVVDGEAVRAVLVNGVFGDAMLHLRLRHQARSLLFDLGDVSRLSTRVLHQVTDVFISHAHADHIGGFMGLLRARIGQTAPCRLYGPPGLAGHVQGMVNGLLWDRVGDRAPEFLVHECHDAVLRRFTVVAGRRTPLSEPELPAPDGLLREEAGFRVRSSVLDHAGTSVLAFAFEPCRQVNVRKERLHALGYEPGPWLTELKRRVRAGDTGGTIALPDGGRRSVLQLADELLLLAQGRRLAYATDLADTAENRARLTALSEGADALICEAAFLDEDADQARRTGHLTAGACGAIAAAAGVRRLIPFHFSARYRDDPARVYRAIASACPSVAVLPGIAPN
ncbi:MBL fold metallo-hydrolase [Arhodomonas sp. SL1]|uniref:MBL fold metallo-hydrolase n=1 Tax=Arhodomonas sp. SL1 TaxID=3425691 RepID=UPI003F880434